MVKDTGNFKMVPVTREAMQENSTSGHYVRLVNVFIEETEPGDLIEIQPQNGKEWEEAEIGRIYQGVRHLIRYRKEVDRPLPITIHRRREKLFLEHL